MVPRHKVPKEVRLFTPGLKNSKWMGPPTTVTPHKQGVQRDPTETLGSFKRTVETANGQSHKHLHGGERAKTWGKNRGAVEAHPHETIVTERHIQTRGEQLPQDNPQV